VTLTAHYNSILTVSFVFGFILEMLVPTRSSRRKSGQSSRCSTADDPVYVEMKPSEAELRQQLQPTRGRKRNQPVPSPSPPTAHKRIKKWELGDINDPSVRNAKAAWANREKKKQELAEMKMELQSKEERIQELSEANVNLTVKLDRAQRLITELTQQQQSANGIVQVQNELSRYLGCVLPQLGDQFGTIPAVVLAPGLLPQEAGTRCITSQFNLDSRVLTISNPGSTTGGNPASLFSLSN